MSNEIKHWFSNSLRFADPLTLFIEERDYYKLIYGTGKNGELAITAILERSRPTSEEDI